MKKLSESDLFHGIVRILQGCAIIVATIAILIKSTFREKIPLSIFMVVVGATFIIMGINWIKFHKIKREGRKNDIKKYP